MQKHYITQHLQVNNGFPSLEDHYQEISEDITSPSSRFLDVKYEENKEPDGDMKQDSNQHDNNFIGDVVSKCEICTG